MSVARILDRVDRFSENLKDAREIVAMCKQIGLGDAKTAETISFLMGSRATPDLIRRAMTSTPTA